MANSEQFVVPGFFKIRTDGPVRIKVGASVVVHQPLVFNLKLRHFFCTGYDHFQIHLKSSKYIPESLDTILSPQLSLFFFLIKVFVEIRMIVMV